MIRQKKVLQVGANGLIWFPALRLVPFIQQLLVPIFEHHVTPVTFVTCAHGERQHNRGNHGSHRDQDQRSDLVLVQHTWGTLQYNTLCNIVKYLQWFNQK